MTKKIEFIVYSHEEQEFRYYTGDRSRFEEVMSSDPSAIEQELTAAGIDGILIMDENSQRWFLGFSSEVGIVAQRTARRQADTIVRSGFDKDGVYIKKNFAMEELSDPNIGDLWRSVQQKYVKSDLTGLDIDPETGLPAQIKERADRLTKVGHSDDLTEAKFSRAEVEERRKAEARSGVEPTKTKKKTKKTTKKTTKKKPTKKKVKTSDPASIPSTKAPAKSKPKKAVAKSKPKKAAELYFKVDEVAEYVKEGYTCIVAKGELTSSSSSKAKSMVLNIDQERITSKEWNEVAVFLDSGTITQVTIEEDDDQSYITSLKV